MNHIRFFGEFPLEPDDGKTREGEGRLGWGQGLPTRPCWFLDWSKKIDLWCFSSQRNFHEEKNPSLSNENPITTLLKYEFIYPLRCLGLGDIIILYLKI
jgi:hypothetical protein